MIFSHIPVLYNECMDILNIKSDGTYVDGTIGGGGHAQGICERLRSGKLIGIDRDIEAINAASERLACFSNTTFVHDNYVNIIEILEELEVDNIDGALLDLGVSSFQLDNAERGFSYMHDAPLDMRMNKEDKLSANYIINNYSEQDLFRIIRDYGEENWAKRIAGFIVNERKRGEIKTTSQLNDIIRKAIPQAARQDGGHPSKRTFQAVRIEVNQEIEKLRQALYNFFNVLAPGGVLTVITFHSLEDRVVKQVFADLVTGCTCPKKFPICICDGKPKGLLVNKKPIVATEAEIKSNSRSKSAKLRGIIKF